MREVLDSSGLLGALLSESDCRKMQVAAADRPGRANNLLYGCVASLPGICVLGR